MRAREESAEMGEGARDKENKKERGPRELRQKEEGHKSNERKDY